LVGFCGIAACNDTVTSLLLFVAGLIVCWYGLGLLLAMGG
jgi:hypothetical protein